jgi:mannosyltransferase OCH1-like enzyme
MLIPKTIFQTTKEKATLHPLLQENILNIIEMNPGYQYYLYDNVEIPRIIHKYYGNAMVGYYNRINPAYGAARADFFRYLLLYETGGVYLDIKSSVQKSLTSVVRPDDVYFLSHWNNRNNKEYFRWGMHPELNGRGEFQQWYIVSIPKHPFLKEVIEQVIRNIDDYAPSRDGVGRMAVLKTTGPIAYTQAILRVVDSYSYRMVDTDKIGFKYSIFEDSEFRFGHQMLGTHYSAVNEPLIL